MTSSTRRSLISWALAALAVLVLGLGVWLLLRPGRSALESAGGGHVASEWSIAPEPHVRIGAEGDPRYEFYRVAGVATLSDGSVIVADGASQELRVFDASGEFMRAFGRPGDGPGEFRGIQRIAVQRDSVLVLEGFPGPPRFHVFDAEGDVLVSTTLRADNSPSGVSPWRILSSTAVVVGRGGVRALSASSLPPEGAVVRDTSTLGILDVEAHVVSWMGAFQTWSLFSYPLPPGGPVSRSMGTYLLGPTLVLGTSDGTIWIGDSGTGSIVLFDAAGSRIAEIQVPVQPRAFDEAALQRARAAVLGASRFSFDSARIEGLYSPDLRPATAPLFSKFTAGPEGEMWVEGFVEDPATPRPVIVFDRRGDQVASVTLPSGLELHAVDRDRLVGVRTDADGVERIVIHRLRR